jgi:arylsulfatase A-like enzyme
MRRTLVSGCLAALLALACGRVEAPRDVLLVVLDTVRADRTSTYGHVRPTSIQMDALARAGVVFEDVTAPAPWTYPSHASLFTGEPPWVHGAHMMLERPELVFGGVAVSRMRSDLPTLAERFAAAGYRTVALSANPWLQPGLGLERGFETVEVFEYDGGAIDAAARELGRDDPRPLFLFVNLLSAHSPFHEGPGEWALADPDFLQAESAPEWVRPYLTTGAPGVNLAVSAQEGAPAGVTLYAAGELAIPPADMQKLLDLYDAGVRTADWGFGRVLESFVAHRPNGVVAVTSDHGEGFGEHGMLDHRASVYAEVLRVPLVIAAPGTLPAGVRVRTPVGLQDTGATLLDLAGVETGPRSLAPLVRGAPRNEPILAAAWPDVAWAIAAGGRHERIWRLYRMGSEALVWSDAGEVELYDLAADPGMRSDLAAARPERAAALRELAARAFPEKDARGEALAVPEDTLERLRQLGYTSDR